MKGLSAGERSGWICVLEENSGSSAEERGRGKEQVRVPAASGSSGMGRWLKRPHGRGGDLSCGEKDSKEEQIVGPGHFWQSEDYGQRHRM